MLSFSPNQNQIHMFQATIMQFVNPNHPLIQLAHQIPWAKLEKDLAKYYSHQGAPAKPIRLMVGLLLLKQLYNLGDETVIEDWKRDPYFQFFTGCAEFQWKQPCDPSDLVHFRKRIGEEGIELLLGMTTHLHKKHKNPDKKHPRLSWKEVIVDTTVQEKNITYPTDLKLHNKIIKQVWKIAEKTGVKLRQSYSRTVKKLNLAQRFAKSTVKKTRMQGIKAQRKIKTLAGRLLRDLSRRLPAELQEGYQSFLDLSNRILKQQRKDKDKIYSLHEPGVSCISKGKVAKKYEFGSKVSVVMSKVGNVVLGVKSFSGNPYDGKTLAASLDQVERLTGETVKKAIVDRGYRGVKQVKEAAIICPVVQDKLNKGAQRRYRQYFRRRAAVEGVISHMKHGYGMARNYLKGELGDQLNCLLAGIGFNIRSYLKKLALGIKNIFLRLLIKMSSRLYPNPLLL